MRKTFKYRLYPNKTTEKNLYFVLNRCRELYNAALSERKDAYRMAGKSITYVDQQNDLPEIKHEIRPEYEDIAAHVLQDVLNRLHKAFQNFFRRCKNGENPGYPRFQGSSRYNSFTYPDGAGWKFAGTHLHLSKIGSIRVKLHRKLEGTIKTVTLKREVDHWYVSFSCEVEEPEKLPVSYEDVGIDLGVSHLATLSSGEMIEHPRYYRQAKHVLEHRQQSLSRKKRGSHRRDKARKLVGKAHRKVANQRRDFLHKETRSLVNRFQVIVFEDIQIGNLTKHAQPKQDEKTGQYLPNGASAKSGLTKSILDAGWGAFMQLCSVKAAWAGRSMVKVNPRSTSQICSQCGTVRKKTLAYRRNTTVRWCDAERIVEPAQHAVAGGLWSWATACH